eukprot:13510310-Ditylum_brightwellii.AAC.1
MEAYAAAVAAAQKKYSYHDNLCLKIAEWKKLYCFHCRVERCNTKWCVDVASAILKKNSSERNRH